MRKDMLPDLLHLYHALATGGCLLPRLLQHFDHDPARVRGASPSALRALGLSAKHVARIKQRGHRRVEQDLDWASQPGNHLVCCYDPAYPALLRQIEDYPVLLYARGKPTLLNEIQIAIVGSRRCTPGGAQNAFEFAGQLAAAGFTITSGMALGIDAEAHRGALAADGNTIAVIATGIDIVYPGRNRRLAAEIIQNGLILSEFPLGEPARRAHFPQRNRIISGLSLGTLVIEAAARSGSLISARLAAEQGREVFAVPGSIHNPQTRGCHQLIRDGAALVETPADITRELGGLASHAVDARTGPPARDLDGVDEAHRRLLECIGYDAVGCDILVQRSGLTIDQLSSMLLVLELNDLIQSAPGGCFVRI